jgi:hypothetical protein
LLKYIRFSSLAKIAGRLEQNPKQSNINLATSLFGLTLFLGIIRYMINRRIIIFLILSSIFAFTHQLAVQASLYWYYWWFDIVMHLWGGILLGLGVHIFSNFSRLHIRPTLPVVLIVLALATGTWEMFEWSAGLWDAETYVFDTAKDVAIGFSGGLLAHIILSKRTIRS